MARRLEGRALDARAFLDLVVCDVLPTNLIEDELDVRPDPLGDRDARRATRLWFGIAPAHAAMVAAGDQFGETGSVAAGAEAARQSRSVIVSAIAVMVAPSFSVFADVRQIVR